MHTTHNTFSLAGLTLHRIIFDPATVGAAATYAHPATPSVGMRHVLVGGQFLIRDGRLLPAARPGRPVLGKVAP